MTSTNRRYVPKNRQESETDRLWAEYEQGKSDSAMAQYIGWAVFFSMIILTVLFINRG